MKRILKKIISWLLVFFLKFLKVQFWSPLTITLGEIDTEMLTERRKSYEWI